MSMHSLQLYGAATMNNTLCLAIFAALVYFKDLDWFYSAGTQNEYLDTVVHKFIYACIHAFCEMHIYVDK